jgi:hypothetical protein
LSQALHLNLDDAWSEELPGVETIDATEWGPRLRFSAPARLIEEFFREYDPQLGAFTLYGSGDFHHLTALWIRRLSEPVVVVSFDNHPDWDVRPPKWCCGGWVNRALELPQVKKVSLWGCGNFEVWWPGQLFGNRRAEREGKLDVHAWADNRPKARQGRRGAIFRATWRDEFERFLVELHAASVYITVDLDCLRAGDAITNWENGLFTTEDVAWALGRLREEVRVIGGDICGAYSKPKYARGTQRFVSEFDHPKLSLPNEQKIAEVNLAALRQLWPVLVSS